MTAAKWLAIQFAYCAQLHCQWQRLSIAHFAEWLMQIYLVGGAVRDQLLGFAVHDRDYVVIGASPEQMLAQGFVAVGRDFPVFLHPQSRCEYALARTERRTGNKHTDFATDCGSDVSLEDDLKRRDLTINAMAQTETGEIIDPYGGAHDIANRILRHVSPAFVEDPLRVLRLARFAASLSRPNQIFKVADSTLQLLKNMVNKGELEHLVVERIWQESKRALAAKMPWLFYEIMLEINALHVVFSNDTHALHIGIAHLKKLRAQDCQCPLSSFAVLCAGLSQATIQHLAAQLNPPKAYRQLALLLQRALEIDIHNADLLIEVIQLGNGWREAQKFADFIGLVAYLQPKRAAVVKAAYNASCQIQVADVIKAGATGAAIGSALLQLRREAILKTLSGAPHATMENTAIDSK